MRLFGLISKTTTWAIEAMDFTRRLPRGRMVTDKKKTTSFSGFHIKVSLHKGEHLFFCYEGPGDCLNLLSRMSGRLVTHYECQHIRRKIVKSIKKQKRYRGIKPIDAS